MIPTRYPLQWPAGWKRTASYMRKNGNFKRYDKRLSIMDGCQRVLEELKRLGVHRDDVVISTNVETRLDGMPRSDRVPPHDRGVCVYWQKGKDPMRCMAVDKYETVADNLAAIAATLDAMRAIERHGGAAVLDRAFTGFTALPAPTSKDWQAVLELHALLQPTVEDVQAAYRRLASQHHPDKGGAAGKMAELNAARDAALKELT